MNGHKEGGRSGKTVRPPLLFPNKIVNSQLPIVNCLLL